MNKNPHFVKRTMEAKHKINDLIRVPEVRIIKLEDESKNGIYPIKEALALAASMEKDLVEISPTANPPVCQIIAYSKFLYEQKKKEKDAKVQQKAAEMKEIRFGPQTDDHDFNFKLKHAEEFLQKGHKVRAFVLFRGREIVYNVQGFKLLERFAKALEDVGKIEAAAKLEGKKVFVTLIPKKPAK